MSRGVLFWRKKLRGVLIKTENLGWGFKIAQKSAKGGVVLEKKVKGGVDFGWKNCLPQLGIVKKR